MPEAPEVERIRQRLLPSRTHRIIAVIFEQNARIRRQLEGQLSNIVDGQIIDIMRIGKYLLFELSSGWLLNHLRMTGSWTVLHADHVSENDHMPRFWRACFFLENRLQMIFTDVRQLGILEFHEINPLTQDQRLTELGPDVSDSDLISKIQALLDEKKRWQNRKLGDLLLDQRFVAGIGNIYRSEILHAARVHPSRTWSSLSARQREHFLRAIQQVMQRALRSQAQEQYPFETGKSPQRVDHDYFMAYGREGESCLHCQTSRISRIKWKGRSIYLCPNCQV